MNVLLVGDSQAVGLSSALERALNAAGHHLVATVAQNGISTYGALQQLQQVTVAPFDLALVVLGGNDFSTSALPAQISALVQQLRLQGAPGAQVIWVGPMYATDQTTATHHVAAGRVQAQLAAALGYHWIDGIPLSQDLTHVADGVHFTTSAYVTLAQRIVVQVAQLTSRAGLWIAAGLFGLAAAGLALWAWSRG